MKVRRESLTFALFGDCERGGHFPTGVLLFDERGHVGRHKDGSLKRAVSGSERDRRTNHGNPSAVGRQKSPRGGGEGGRSIR